MDKTESVKIVNDTARENNPACRDMLPCSIEEAGQWLRDGSITSEALVARYIRYRRVLEPRLNAFITVSDDDALETAALRDKELRHGKDRGPLHGIPIVHKDILDTEGLATTMGSESCARRVPRQDAIVVKRCKDAGAICLGKTNMNEYAAGISGQNAYFGDAHNPWDLSRAPGGSSSGTAVAVAAGLCLGGTGTDTGGSIRAPAAWCGIVGIRPTYGRVSLEGVHPRAYSLDCAGPLARTVGDVARLLEVISACDPRDGNADLVPFSSDRATLSEDISGLRLGIVKDYSFHNLDPEVSTAFQKALNVLAGLGADITEVSIPSLSGDIDLSSLYNITLYEFNQILGETFGNAEDTSVFGPIVRNNIEEGRRLSRESYEAALADKERKVEEMAVVFRGVDALLTPTMPILPPLLTASPEEFFAARQFMMPFNMTNVPSISVPGGFSEKGLPIGLQIVGGHFREETIIRIAAAFEGATGFHVRRPPVSCEQAVIE